MLDEEWTGGPSFYAGLEWKEGEMRKREIGFCTEARFSVQVWSIGPVDFGFLFGLGVLPMSMSTS